MLRTRLELLNELWASGVRAETLPRSSPSLTEQYEFARGRGARWLLLISEAELAASGCVRLKPLGRAADEEAVPRDSVVARLARLTGAG